MQVTMGTAHSASVHYHGPVRPVHVVLSDLHCIGRDTPKPEFIRILDRHQAFWIVMIRIHSAKRQFTGVVLTIRKARKLVRGNWRGYEFGLRERLKKCWNMLLGDVLIEIFSKKKRLDNAFSTDWFAQTKQPIEWDIISENNCN
jgi:hypothetical protein